MIVTFSLAGLELAAADETGAGSPDGPTAVTVRRVKLRISQSRYVWSRSETSDRFSLQGDKGDGIPRREDSRDDGREDASSPETVISFLGFRPGETLSPGRLERKAALAEFRLRESGYFYRVSVDVLPSRRDPEMRTVMVVVEDGFRARYGGGSVYGLIGRVNAGGERRSWGAVLGLNRVRLQYRDDLLGGRRFFGGVSAGYLNRGVVSEGPVVHRFQAEAVAGGRYHPDGAAAAGLSWQWPDAEAGPAGASWLKGRLNWSHRIILLPGLEGLSLVLPAEAEVWGVQNPEGSRRSAGVVGRMGLDGGCGRWEFSLSGSGQRSGLAGPLPKALWTDFFDPGGLSVRSGYQEDELQAADYGWGRAWTAVRAVTLEFPPLITLDVSPGIFAETALLKRDESGGNSSWELREAWGGGFRFFFAAPVFVTAEVTAGWNRQGRMRVALTAVTQL